MTFTKAISIALEKLEKLADKSSIAIPPAYTLEPTILVIYNPDGSHKWGYSQHPERYFLKSNISKKIISDVDKNGWGMSAINLYVDSRKPLLTWCYSLEELGGETHHVTLSLPYVYIPKEIKERWKHGKLSDEDIHGINDPHWQFVPIRLHKGLKRIYAWLQHS